MNNPGVVKESCPDCAAAQIMPWRVYRKDCPECNIRCIANMRQEDREHLYEQIEDQIGRKNMLTIKERVGLEVVRMRLLREGKAR